MASFEIGDLVKWIDGKGIESELHIVVEVDEESERLTADRYSQGKFTHSINADFKHFKKHRSVKDYYHQKLS